VGHGRILAATGHSEIFRSCLFNAGPDIVRDDGKRWRLRFVVR
jgi:hypothetical protein